MGVAHFVIGRVILLALLEDEIVVERNFTRIVLQAPAAEPRFLTIALVGFHTEVSIDNMRIVDRRIIGRGETEVIGQQPVVRTGVDTAGGQNRYGNGVNIIRILVQQRVVVANRRRTHGPVGIRLIGSLAYVMLLRSSGIAHRRQRRSLESLESLPLQFALEFHIGDVQVDIVVRQFMENIEIRIVTDIILLRIEHARSIQGIRIRVDVEIALHLARYIVGRGAERSGRFLLTVRTVGNQVERKGVRDIIRRIEIGRITGNLAGLRPSRIEKGADRRIVGGLLGTRSDTYRMRVHDRILEKLLEPVRVAVLGLAQVAVARLHGVFQQSGIDQRIHLAVNTARRRVGDTRIAQPALVVQLLIDGHLVLRVHDVEIGVGGNHTIRELARIIDMADAGTSLFGRNDDHAGHSARTVDRGGRTVLQDIETLDILGVQTRDGGTDQRRGVTRREVLGRNIGDILHNYAVHNPKRLRAAVNRRRTADADLGSGTESTRYVLHRDTGRTAFQTAADIGQTR